MKSIAFAIFLVLVMMGLIWANIGLCSFNAQCNSGNDLISVHDMTNTNRSDAIVLRF